VRWREVIAEDWRECSGSGSFSEHAAEKRASPPQRKRNATPCEGPRRPAAHRLTCKRAGYADVHDDRAGDLALCESIINKNLVAWVTMGFHFEIKPVGFFARNPAIDIPKP
jgi:hypothetical protein